MSLRQARVSLEASTGPLEEPLHRDGGGIEHRRHLGESEAKHVVEQERRALPGRQALESGDEGETDRVAGFEACLRVSWLLDPSVGVGLQPGRLEGPGRSGRAERWDGYGRWSALGVTDGVEAAVGGDPIHPGTKRRPTAEAPDRPPGGDHRVLEDVVGVGERAEHPVAVQVQLGAIRRHQVAEGVVVSALGAFEQRCNHRGELATAKTSLATTVPIRRRQVSHLVGSTQKGADMTEVLGAESTLIETYYEILQSGADRFDAEQLRAILAPQLVFEGPIAGHRVGAEPFCKGVVGFVHSLQRLEMRQLVTTPAQAAALYDAELPGGTCRFAEFFELDTEVITGLRLLFDPKRYIEVGGH
jgi:hypothetical protein